MIAAHQTMLAPQGAPLPYDAEVEYLESTGTQWIDTGYYASNRTDIELSFQPGTFNYTAGWRCLFGARMNNIGASSNRINTPMIWMSRDRQLALNDYQNYDSGGTSAYAPANAQSVFEIRGRKLYLNGTQYVASGQTSTYQSTVTTGLLRCRFADGWEAATEASRQLPGKIYYMKFYEDGVLAEHLVPVRVGQVGYLFDRVSGELFGNAGTGAFVVGPDKNGV